MKSSFNPANIPVSSVRKQLSFKFNRERFFKRWKESTGIFESLLYPRFKMLIFFNREKAALSISSSRLPCNSSDFSFTCLGNLEISLSRFPWRSSVIRFSNFLMTFVSKNVREDLAIYKLRRLGSSSKSSICILEMLLCESTKRVVYSGIPRGTLSRFWFSQYVIRVLSKHRHWNGHDSIHVTLKYIIRIIIMIFVLIVVLLYLLLQQKNVQTKYIPFVISLEMNVIFWRIQSR